MHQVICTDALTLLDSIDYARMVFVNPPDNSQLSDLIEIGVAKADIFWLSYSEEWAPEVALIVDKLLESYEGLQVEPCIQMYNSGNKPLLRITQENIELYPTDEDSSLIEHCVHLSCRRYDTVIDPFAGDGTTLRLCKCLGISCVTGDTDPQICAKIADENDLQPALSNYWPDGRWYGGQGVGLCSRVSGQ